jgi:6-pyruvoyltetrahydropterin/6-carboxytetrahydropterin synthase
MHVSTKTYGHDVGLSACFRQWRAKSHCRLLHGYALAVKLEFEAETLDHRNWVVDFGGMGAFKAWLCDTFDHTLVVAEDDPNLFELRALDGMGLARVIVLPAVGCEAFAQHIHSAGTAWLQGLGLTHRVRLRSVEVREHGANSAIYEQPRTDIEL